MTVRSRTTALNSSVLKFAVSATCALTLCGSVYAQDPHNPEVLMRAINPPGANIPGISQAILVEEGQLLFLSGHVPINEGGVIAGPGLEEQLRQVFTNMEHTLRAAGADFSNVVRLTIYVRDYRPDQLGSIREVRDEFVSNANPPTSALIGVAALFQEDVRVEIDAVAIVPSTPN